MEQFDQLKNAYSERRLDDAWALYRQADATGEAEPEAHLIGARTARLRGDLWAARGAIEKAGAGCPRGDTLGQIGFCSGVVLRELGDVRAAVDQFRAFIADADEYPQTFAMAEGHAWFNLALALRQCREYQEALDAYQRACAAHRRNGLLVSLCEALHNMAWTACMTGNRVLAQAALAEADPHSTDERLRVHQQLGEAFAGILGESEEKREAMETCHTLLSHHDAIPHEIRSHACWLAGRVALHMGQLDQAEDLAKQAVHHASLHKGESRCLTDASALLREVRERRINMQPGA